MDPIEADIECPYCGETFLSYVDPSETKQTYIEDCYVCCRPIKITTTCVDDEIQSIQIEKE